MQSGVEVLRASGVGGAEGLKALACVHTNEDDGFGMCT